MNTKPLDESLLVFEDWMKLKPEQENDIKALLSFVSDLLDEDTFMYVFRGGHGGHDAFTGNLVRIQYDGEHPELEKGACSQDTFRIVWRDLVIGWYKYPHRGVEINRWPDMTERAQFMQEVEEELAPYLAHITRNGIAPHNQPKGTRYDYRSTPSPDNT